MLKFVCLGCLVLHFIGQWKGELEERASGGGVSVRLRDELQWSTSLLLDMF